MMTQPFASKGSLDRRTVLAGAGAGLILSACATSSAGDAMAMKESYLQSGEVQLKLYEMGEGPLVILVHGWPELAYSWRYQMPALAAAGYKVVAPDMRGYGDSSNPREVSAYSIQKLTQDIVNIVDHYGAEHASLVGHDWGAIVGWNTILLHPKRFNGYAAMSVPYDGRAPIAPLDGMRAMTGENFFYIVYFQEDGVAEAEFNANPRGILKRLYAEPSTPRAPREVTDPKRAAGGWIPRLGEPLEYPSWMTATDLDHYVAKFSQSGFHGGINYYRNMNENWRTTPQLQGTMIDHPVIFLAGEKDTVIRGASADNLTTRMTKVCTDFRGVTLYPGAGHWIQQERADAVNADLIAFLGQIN